MRETVAVMLEEVTERKSLPRVLVHRIDLQRALGGPTRARERLGARVEVKSVFVQIQVREPRPERCDSRLLFHELLEAVAQHAMLNRRVLTMVGPVSKAQFLDAQVGERTRTDAEA